MHSVISKSKYLAGLQCLKYLWTLINEPEKIPQYDEVAMFRFQQGHEVGELAKSLFPGGIEMQHGIDIEAELAMAKRLAGLKAPAGNSVIYANESPDSRLPLFEPAFSYKNSFARADILEPVSGGFWNIIEVKSATSVKDINLHDLAFQKYCYAGAGLKINRCYLMYLNKDYIRQKAINPRQLFISQDVSSDVDVLKGEVEGKILAMLDAVNSKICPKEDISRNCFDPYDCQLRKFCWSHLPQNSVFELYRAKNLAFDFYNNGIASITDIDNISLLDHIQLKQYSSVIKGCPVIERDKIKLFLDKLKYPLYFLDFETFATAIPLFDGLGPYQAVPFQFSCHKLDSRYDKPQNYYFLAENDGSDPRPGFLESLKRVLGYNEIKNDDYPSGSILVYYESFEKNILKRLAGTYPEHSWWIDDAISRIQDLYEPFGKFYYYSYLQKGSASLKNVLPAIAGISYDGMEIKNGQEASLKYLDIAFLKKDTVNGKEGTEKIKKDLLDYCGLDTEGMIYILLKLYKLAD
jgi:hypothetical protein